MISVLHGESITDQASPRTPTQRTFQPQEAVQPQRNQTILQAGMECVQLQFHVPWIAVSSTVQSISTSACMLARASSPGTQSLLYTTTDIATHRSTERALRKNLQALERHVPNLVVRMLHAGVPREVRGCIFSPCHMPRCEHVNKLSDSSARRGDGLLTPKAAQQRADMCM